MPLGEYLMYTAGFVPKSDVDAQIRCNNVLVKALSAVNKEVAAGNDAARPELAQLQSTRNMLKEWAGAYNWRKAENFWNYWDKNKQQILSLSGGDYLSQVEELEQGRYYND